MRGNATTVVNPACSGFVGLLNLGEDVSLRRAGAGPAAAGTAQGVGEGDGEYGAGERAGDVDPVVAELAADEVGSEGACGVHRGAGDRTPPQARPRDGA